jgi:hypothetical protein
MRQEGLANWTAEARAKSLAIRRAKGSVWGWDKRARALESVSSEALTKSLESLEEFDASATAIRAPTAEDELNFISEEEYQQVLDEEERAKRNYQAMEMGMMAAIGSPLRAVGLGKKTVSVAADAVNSSRAVVTAYDLSAPFRQGGIVSLSHPSFIPRAYVLMLRAAKSEQSAKAVARLLRMRQNYPLYGKSGLYLADTGKGAEEVFKAVFAKKIPGVQLSERAYNAYLNSVRADCFDSLLAALKATGNANVTRAEMKAIANYINVATGRGSLGAAEKYAGELSTIFFAPKLTASRWQFFLGQPMVAGSARTRMIIAGEYGKYLAGLGTLYGLAKISGAEVTWDPRSTDFGKIRYGANRIDPLSGLGKHAVYAARIITGTFEGASGKTEPIYDGKGRNNWDDLTERYLRSTLSPLYGTAVTLATGRGIDGKPYKAKDVPYDLLPLSARDIYEQYRDNSFGTATAMSLISLHGGGIDTYVKKEPRMTKAQVIKAIENGEAFDAASLYK